MNIEVLSFGLAMGVGVVCYALIKRTVDEVDSWYGQPRTPAKSGLLATLASTITLIGSALVSFVR